MAVCPGSGFLTSGLYSLCRRVRGTTPRAPGLAGRFPGDTMHAAAAPAEDFNAQWGEPGDERTAEAAFVGGAVSRLS